MKETIVVLASGTGTNFQAIIDAVAMGTLDVTIGMLITDRPGVLALSRAVRAGIPATVIDRREYRERLSDAILATIPPETALIVLAGFLSILKGEILQRYRGRIINLHPSLLPRHGGAGMYGSRVHEAVLAAGDAESGCTIHVVDEGTDTGPILLQRSLSVEEGDTPETLARRIAVLEHEAIVDGIRTVLNR
ncbi:MAG: phosphoribosylglycinamide formyltransferase [Alkalispirochaeta sp.]